MVCWLESLAAQRLQNTPPARFAHHEGLWRETLLTSGGSGSKGFSNSSGSTTARELDPDAASRGKLKLAAGDLQGEERLAAHLWQLIRAGKRLQRQLQRQRYQFCRYVVPAHFSRMAPQEGAVEAAYSSCIQCGTAAQASLLLESVCNCSSLACCCLSVSPCLQARCVRRVSCAVRRARPGAACHWQGEGYGALCPWGRQQ